MIYLLDTNVCIRYLNGRAPQIRTRLDAIPDTDIVISTVTKAEMYSGSARSQTPQASRARQDAFFIRFVSVSFDDDAADELGRIDAHLKQAGLPIGPYDLQIAAIAVVHQLIVVTHNIKEFGRIPWLKTEDWEV